MAGNKDGIAWLSWVQLMKTVIDLQIQSGSAVDHLMRLRCRDINMITRAIQALLRATDWPA